MLSCARLTLLLAICCIAGCDTRPANRADSDVKMPSDEEYRLAKEKGLDLADKLREQGESAPRIPLPNFVAGAGFPPPIGINFYEQRDYYPGFLLCTYDVEERRYDQSNEGGWFRAALLQIRGEGPDHFPPFKWVAVIIRNTEEQRRVGFEQAHKVGAIFDLGKVFDPGVDPAQLVAQADLDRHPLRYDPRQPTPGEQQRWLIVERRLAKVSAGEARKAKWLASAACGLTPEPSGRYGRPASPGGE